MSCSWECFVLFSGTISYIVKIKWGKHDMEILNLYIIHSFVHIKYLRLTFICKVLFRHGTFSILNTKDPKVSIHKSHSLNCSNKQGNLSLAKELLCGYCNSFLGKQDPLSKWYSLSLANFNNLKFWSCKIKYRTQ